MKKKMYLEYLSNRFGYQFRRASDAMMADLRNRLDEENVNPTQASILLIVADNAGITQSDVCRILGIKRANMVPLIAKLESDKLIERYPLDGRSHALTVTPLGESVLEKVKSHIEEHEARYLSRLDADFVARLMRELPKLWEE